MSNPQSTSNPLDGQYAGADSTQQQNYERANWSKLHSSGYDNSVKPGVQSSSSKDAPAIEISRSLPDGSSYVELSDHPGWIREFTDGHGNTYHRCAYSATDWKDEKGKFFGSLEVTPGKDGLNLKPVASDQPFTPVNNSRTVYRPGGGECTVDIGTGTVLSYSDKDGQKWVRDQQDPYRWTNITTWRENCRMWPR